MRAPTTRFDAAVERLLRREGGYSDHARDKGGKTKYGISLRFAQAEARASAGVRALLDLDMDGDVDGRDIRALTPDAARAVYRRCCWDRAGCGALPPPIDELVFDAAVNGGVLAARKLLQRALNLLDAELAIDGAIGPETLKALRERDPRAVGRAYLIVLRNRYRSIVSADPSQAVFLRGWMARADDLEALV